MPNERTPERILYVHGSTMNRGGTEAYMMNYYRNFDREQLQVDFAVHGFCAGAWDDEIRAMGGRIIHLPVKSKDPIGNVRALRKLLSSGEYRVVHAQLDAMNSLVLKIAKSCGIPVRISHSHNTAVQTANPLKQLLNEMARRQIPRVATHLFACSEPAGTWLYGNHPFRIIPNAIDLGRFAFDPQKRSALRTALEIPEEALVLGHVGRFNAQKNHTFFVPLLKALLERDDRYRLVLVGEGPLKEPLRKLAEQEGVAHAIRFVDACSNVQDYYSVFDVFCLPSLFEGLPVVGLEAQAAGLPLLVSDTVSEELNLTGNVTFLPITEGEACWVRQLTGGIPVRDPGAAGKLREAGYDIREAARMLQDWYLNGSREEKTE